MPLVPLLEIGRGFFIWPPPVSRLSHGGLFPIALSTALPANFAAMINWAKSQVLSFLNARGFQVIRSTTGFSPEELRTLELVKGYTCGSAERIIGVVNAAKYVAANKIPGAIVECGVWRGGSMMAAAAALLNVKDTSRDIYLFDTFEGMSEPTEKDVMFDGQKASSLLGSSERKEGIINYWCVAGIEDVTRNVTSTGYPKEKLHFIKGKVEDTIPKHAPDQIALLRLDTDWYESTAHELEHLFPRVAPNGVVIIDDYGHWQGAREAVDEYFAKRKFKPLFNRQDYTGRLLVKPSA